MCVGLCRFGEARCGLPYYSRTGLRVAQKAAAAKILSRVREEVATRNAASMHGPGGGGVPVEVVF
jgi:hypothetical protein